MLVKRSLCIVFDLDDTLYSERDYQVSGFRAVAQYIKLVYGQDLEEVISQWAAIGEADIFGRICFILGIPASCKESFVWVYRNHFPEISLSDIAVRVLRTIQASVSAVAVLTDGRSTTQRLKLKALGLSHLPVFISEEWGDAKPGKVRFEAIQKQYQADCYWYIGDNPKKDFVAPNQLGWTSVGLRGGVRNIHSQDISNLSTEYLPKCWIDSLDEILAAIGRG